MYQVFNFQITFGALDSAVESTNTSLLIGFPWRKASFISIALHFHSLQKNNIKASCTYCYKEVSLSAVVQSSQNLLQQIFPFTEKFYPFNKYAFLASVFIFVRPVIFLQQYSNPQPLRPAWPFWLNGSWN